MRELRESIGYYETSGTLKAMILRSFDQSIFSHGTDYKRMASLTEQSDSEKIQEYLSELCRFSCSMAECNLPIITSIDGLLSNSAASIFTSMPFVFDQGKTTLQFNDIKFNSSLTGGSTFFLSRLPNSIGVFLGLTGMKVRGKDLLDLGFIKGASPISGENMLFLSNSLARVNEVANIESSYTPAFGITLSPKADTNKSIKEFFDRSTKESSKNVLFDLYYRKKMIESANVNYSDQLSNPFNTSRMNEEKWSNVENYLNCFEEDIIDRLPIKGDLRQGFLTEEKIKLIARVFSRNTMSEIYESLEKESGEFALEIKRFLQENDSMLNSLTLEMIKKGQNLTYSECLRLEFHTAYNISTNSLTKTFAFKKGEQGISLSSEEQIDLVNKLLEKSACSENGLYLTDNAMLPTKNYYTKFPEAFRCFIGEYPLRRDVLLNNFKKTVETTFLRYGIDPLNPTFDKEFSANKLRLAFDWYRKCEIKNQRVLELANDPLLLSEYIGTREEEIDKLVRDEGKLKNKIKEIIKVVFKDESDLRDEKLIEKSRILNFKEKEKMIQEYKDVLIESRLTQRASDSWLGDHFRRLPSEIGTDRFTLSKNSEASKYLEEVKNNYSLNLNINNKTELKHVLNSKEDLNAHIGLIKNSDGKTLDEDSFGLGTKANHWIKKLNLNLKKQERKALAIYLNGTPKSEITFREKFVSEFINDIKQSGVQLTDENKKEIVSFVHGRFFNDFSKSQTLEEIIKFSRDNFLEFCADLSKTSNSFTLENTILNQNDRGGAEAPNESDFNAILELQKELKLDLSNNEKVEKEIVLNSSFTFLKKLILESSHMSGIEKIFFELITSNDNIQPFKTIQDFMYDLYEFKFIELFQTEEIVESLPSGDDVLSISLARKAKADLLNHFSSFIAPHLFLNTSIKGIELLEELLVEINMALTGSEDMKEKLLSKNISTDSEELKVIAEKLDKTASLCSELYMSYKDRVFMKEDLLACALFRAKETARIKLRVMMIEEEKLRIAYQDYKLEKEESDTNNKYEHVFNELTSDDIAQEKSTEEVKVSEENVSKSVDILSVNNKSKEVQSEIEVENKIEAPGYLDPVITDKEPKKLKKVIEDTNRKSLKKDYYNFFEHAYASSCINSKAMDSYEVKLSEYLQNIEQWKDGVGIDSKSPLISSKLEKVKSVFDSPNLRQAENLRFDKFVKEMANRDPKLYESFNTLHALSDQGPITRLIFATSKLRSALECQTIGFDQKTYSSFFSSYMMSTDSANQLIEYFKEYHKRDSLGWNQDKLPDMVERSYLNQNPDKKYLVPEAYNSLSQINHLTLKFCNGGLPTGLEDFYYKLNAEVVRIPDSFKELDIRQNPSDWIDTSLYIYLHSVFMLRRESEKKLTDIELRWNDADLSVLFSKDIIKKYLKAKLQGEETIVEEVGQYNFNLTENLEENLMSISRSDPDKVNWEKGLVNETALKKLLSFESFSYNDHGQKKREFFRDLYYLENLVKESSKAPVEDVPEVKLGVKQKDNNLDIVQTNLIDLDNVTAYITEVVSSRRKTEAETISEELSKSLSNLSKRIELYK